jgi:phage-related tail protein
MNEEIQEVDRLTKQVGDLTESLIRYARKLQNQRRHRPDPNQERSKSFAALLEKLMNLGARSAVFSQEMEKELLRHEQQARVEAGISATNGTSMPQDTVIELLRVSVTRFGRLVLTRKPRRNPWSHI